MSVEEKLQEVFNMVLDVKPQDIKPDAPLSQSLDVDSTELIEITVGLKKSLGVALADNELKKTHSFNDIVKILISKGV